MRTSNILESFLLGPWYAVVFWPQKTAARSTSKLVRLAGWFASFLWFAFLLPITCLIMLTLGAIDIWRNV